MVEGGEAGVTRAAARLHNLVRSVPVLRALLYLFGPAFEVLAFKGSGRGQ